MKAGGLRETIQLFASTATTGTSGQAISSWSATPFATLNARKRTLSQREETVASARNSTEDAVFEIRYVDGIVDTMRLLHGSTYYDITDIVDPTGRKAQLMIYASSGKRIGA